MVQLPSAGMFAWARLTAVVVLVSDAAAPPQVVAAAGVAARVRFVGSVSAKLDCVSAKPLVFESVMVSVDTELFTVVAGENVSLTVGATGVTVMAAGHAVALVPADVGAVPMALPAVSATVSVSMFPAESVTVKVKVPGAGWTVTRAFFAPLTMRLEGDAVHAWAAMLSGAGAV